MLQKFKKTNLIKIFFSICIAQIFFIPLIKYYTLNTFYADFGVFLNHIYNVIEEPSLILKGHFQPILYLFGFFNFFFSYEAIPYTLILTQSIFIVFCSFLIRKYFSFNSLIAFFLFIPTYTLAFKDFHLDFIFLFTFLLFFIFIKQKKYYSAILIQNLFFLSKEFYIIYALLTNLYLINLFYNENKSYLKYCFVSLILNLVLFIYTVYILLPSYNDGVNIISNLNNNQNFFINLNFLLDINFYKFFIICVLPIIFVSFKDKKYWIFLVPNFLIIILFDNKNFYNYNSHYFSSFIPLMVYLIDKNINLANRVFFIYLILIQVAFGNNIFSRLFWISKIDEISIHQILKIRQANNYKKIIREYIPKSKDVLVITQNNINWHNLAYRKSYKIFPEGLEDNTYETKFVILNRQIEPFVGDEGCNYIYNKCENIYIQNEYSKILNILMNSYEILYRSKSLIILKK